MRKMSVLVLLACFIGTAFGAWGTNTVVRPNGGNGWAAGLVKPIRWSHTKKDTVKIELWKGSVKFLTIADSVQRNVPVSPATYSQYLWTIPKSMPAGTNYKVRIMNYQNNAQGKDSSDANFAVIINPRVNLTAPDGGEVLLKDRPTTITWTSNLTDSVRIVLLKGATPVFNSAIDTVAASSGSYIWNVPANLTAGVDYKIRIEHFETDFLTVRDSSYDFIEIKDIPYSITAPNTSGIKWLKGSTKNITWTSSSATDSLYLKLLKGGAILTGADSIRRKAISGALNTYAWKIPKTLANATNYKVRINGQTNTSNIDSSNFTFGVYDSLLLDSTSLYSNVFAYTNAKKQVKLDSAYTIKWINSSNIPAGDSIKIDLYKGTTLNSTIARVLATPVTYTWTVPAALTAAADYSIKISSIRDPLIFRDSSKVFTIGQPPINITSPNGGEFLLTGAARNITLTTTAAAGANVQLELVKGGSSVAFLDTLDNSTPGDLTYSWTPATGLTAGTDYKIKVNHLTDATITDISSANFSIAESRVIAVTAPNGGGALYRGTQSTITWTHNFGENVEVNLIRNGVVVSRLDTVVVTGTAGSFVWNIPGNLAEGYTYKIGLVNVDFRDTRDSSDANFKILESSIRVTSPDLSTTTWLKGETRNITWVSTGLPEDVKIELIAEGTGTATTVVASAPNNNAGVNGSIPDSYLGTYSWSIPTSGLADSLKYKVKISSILTPGTNDLSNEFFIIKNAPGVTITSPDASGVKFYKGATHAITWTDNFAQNVKISLMKEITPVTVPKKYRHHSWIKTSTPSNGSYSWNVPTSLPDGLDYKIKIQSINADSLTVRDSSSNAFQLLSAPLIVIKPNSVGKYGTWTKDSTVVISYSVNATLTGNLKFEIFQGVSATPVYTYPTIVAAGAAGAKTLSFKLPTTIPTSDSCKVKISTLTNATPYSDISDSNFTIQYAWKAADIGDTFIKEFKLEQNYPNPFNNSTEIVYSVPTGYNDNVKISIYNVKGEIVSRLVNKIHTGGRHFVNFNASAVVSGVYYYVIEGNNFKDTKRMLLLK